MAMKSKLIVAFILGTVLLRLPPLHAQTPTLAGSWQFTLSPGAGSTDPVVFALATFTTDGSMIETDSSEVSGIAAATRSTRATGGHGIWQPAPVPGNLYLQFISLIINPNGSVYLQKKVTIFGAMDSSGNNFSGTYSYTLTNPVGGFVGSGSGTIAGERIPHPLLP